MKLSDKQFKAIKDRIYRKYGNGIDRNLFESIRCHDVFSLDQASFRGRNDDGSETAATWKAAANTNWTQDTGTNFRVRFLVQEIGAGTASGTIANSFDTVTNWIWLQYNKNSTGWQNVHSGTSNVKMSLSSNFANGDNTTQQIGSGTFVAGEMDESALSSFTINFSGDDETEIEVCLQIVEADVSDGDTIQLRLTGQGGGSVLDSYTNIPSITVNITGGTTHLGAASINGVATVTAKGRATFSGSSSIAGSGTLTPKAGVVLSGKASINGSATLAPTAGLVLEGKASLNGSGALSPSGNIDILGKTSVNGSGTLTPNGRVEHSAKVSINGTGTLTPVAGTVRAGKAAINGSGTLAPTGGLVLLGKASLNGTATVSPTGTNERVVLGAASISGAGTLSAKPIMDYSASVAINGTGTLSPKPSVDLTGKASLNGTGALSPSAGLLLTGAVSLNGTGTLAAKGSADKPGAASINGTASIAANGTVTTPAGTTHFGQASISGSGSLSAKAAVDHKAKASLNGAGTVSALGGLTLKGAVSLVGSGSVSALAQKELSGLVSILGSGFLTPSALRDVGGKASIAGSGTLSPLARVSIFAKAGLLGAAYLVAKGSIPGEVISIWTEQSEKTTLWTEQTEVIGKNDRDSLLGDDGFFDAGLGSWINDSIGTATIGWNPSGYMTLTDQNSDNAQASKLISGLEIGQTYTIDFDVIGTDDLQLRIGVVKAQSEVYSRLAGGATTAEFTATQESLWMTAFVQGVWVSPRTTGIDNIVILKKEVSQTVWTGQDDQTTVWA